MHKELTEAQELPPGIAMAELERLNALFMQATQSDVKTWVEQNRRAMAFWSFMSELRIAWPSIYQSLSGKDECQRR